MKPVDLKAIAEGFAEGALRVMAGASVAAKEIRGEIRERMRPELQALGVDHINPFDVAGKRALQQARRRRDAEARAARGEQLTRLWDDHDRSIAMPLAERYPELLTDDVSPDLPGVVTGRYRRLEKMAPTPDELLPTMPEDGVGGGE